MGLFAPFLGKSELTLTNKPIGEPMKVNIYGEAKDLLIDEYEKLHQEERPSLTLFTQQILIRYLQGLLANEQNKNTIKSK